MSKVEVPTTLSLFAWFPAFAGMTALYILLLGSTAAQDLFLHPFYLHPEPYVVQDFVSLRVTSWLTLLSFARHVSHVPPRDGHVAVSKRGSRGVPTWSRD